MFIIARAMAFDFGTKNIGVAIGQRITCTAQPIETLQIYNKVPDWQKIKKLIKEWLPDILIVGLPLNMDGSEQKMTSYTRNFAYVLQNNFKIQVILHDERLSTMEARTRIFNYSGYRALKKSKIDAYSAAIILESWFKEFNINIDL